MPSTGSGPPNPVSSPLCAGNKQDTDANGHLDLENLPQSTLTDQKDRFMTLSEHEQRSLAEIETGCRTEDPDFVTRMNLAAQRSRRTRLKLLAQGAIWIGTLVFVLGAGAARGLVSGGAIIACYGAAMIITGIVTWVHHHAHHTGTRPD